MTLALAHLVPKGLESLSLKDIMEFLGIEPEPEIHEAINGAKACRDVWVHLTGEIK